MDSNRLTYPLPITHYVFTAGLNEPRAADRTCVPPDTPRKFPYPLYCIWSGVESDWTVIPEDTELADPVLGNRNLNFGF
jgi:hypothetical protein